MGYDTEYFGIISLNKPLDDETYTFLTQLAKTRRMKRNLGPEYGIEGEYFVEGDWNTEPRPETILDYNNPPSIQPGHWCQWVPTEDRQGLEWDGGEKFYCGPEWMDYIIHRILAPKGYVCNGTLVAQGGEDNNDYWKLYVKNNIVSTDYSIMPGSFIAQVPKEDLPTILKDINETYANSALAKVIFFERLNY